MSEVTEKGEQIADQIQGHTAYGESGDLSIADVWLMVDHLHTHFLNTGRDNSMFERWMRELEALDDDLPPL